MRRGINEVLIAGEKVRARGRAFAAGDEHRRPSLWADAINAVALLSGAASLKRQLGAVERPIGLRVLPAEREAAQVRQVHLLGKRVNERPLWAGARCGAAGEQPKHEYAHLACMTHAAGARQAQRIEPAKAFGAKLVPKTSGVATQVETKCPASNRNWRLGITVLTLREATVGRAWVGARYRPAALRVSGRLARGRAVHCGGGSLLDRIPCVPPTCSRAGTGMGTPGRHVRDVAGSERSSPARGWAGDGCVRAITRPRRTTALV